MLRIARILCPVDFSETSQHALDHAAAIARWYDATLTLLHVFTSLPATDLPPIVLDPAERERLRGTVATMAARAGAGTGIDIRVVQAQYVHNEIVRQVEDAHADLLVLGTHGRSGFQRLFLGSVTEKVIRQATCPALVVPPRATDPSPGATVQFKQILCAVDFSESSLSALEWASTLAAEADAHLTLLHVIEMPPELRENPLTPDFDIDRIHAAAEAAALRRLRDLIPDQARTYATVETAVAEGRAYGRILQRAAEQNVDLIVMGVQGRGPVDLLVFGSTAHRVIRTATCPVLIVRAG